MCGGAGRIVIIPCHTFGPELGAYSGGAEEWCRQEENRRIRGHLVGEERALTCAEGVLLYPANAKTASYLLPLLDRLGEMPVVDITPKMIREMAAEMYPDA